MNMKIIALKSEPNFCPVVFSKLLDVMEIENFDASLIWDPWNSSSGSFCLLTNSVTINWNSISIKSAATNYPWWQNNFWTCMSHELVHYKQNKQNRLRIETFARKRRISWDGMVHDEIREHYNLQPWELDANRESNKAISKLIKQGIIGVNANPTQTFEEWEEAQFNDLVRDIGSRQLPRSIFDYTLQKNNKSILSEYEKYLT